MKFEDVSPSKNGDFPLPAMLVFKEGKETPFWGPHESWLLRASWQPLVPTLEGFG